MTTIAENVDYTWNFTGLPLWGAGGKGSGYAYVGQIPASKVDTAQKMPNWRKRIQNHENATTSRVARELRFTPYDSFWMEAGYRERGKPGGEIFTMTINGYPVMPTIPGYDTATSPEFKECNDRALEKFIKNANSHLHKAQGGPIIGELRETLRMLRHPYDSFRKQGPQLYRRLQRQLAASNKKLQTGNMLLSDFKKEVANAWLETQFGWKPLLQDVADVLILLQELERKVDQSYADGQWTSETPTSRPSSGEGRQIILGFDYHHKRSKTYRTHWYGGIVHKISTFAGAFPKVDKDASELIDSLTVQLGLDDGGATTLWELTPWSFLVDYFSNVGAMIEVASFSDAHLAWAGRSHRITVTEEVQVFPNRRVTSEWLGYSNRELVYLTASGNEPFRITAESLDRGPSSISIPSIRFELPGSSTQWANLAALFL